MSEEFDRTLKRALGILAKRDLFEAELRTRLGDHPSETVDQVVEHLRAKGILSDLRRAEGIAHYRSGRRSVAPRLLLQELHDRGAPDAAIQVISEGASDGISAAKAILESSFLPLSSERARAGRALARRGFDNDEIEAALDRYFGDESG